MKKDKQREKIVKELKKARARVTTATARIEKAGATNAPAYKALQARGGVQTQIRGVSTAALREELKSLKRFEKSKVATKQGLYEYQHRAPLVRARERAFSTFKKNETSYTFTAGLTGQDIDRMSANELKDYVKETSKAVNAQVKAMKTIYGETPATIGYEKAGEVTEQDIETASYNDLRKYGWRLVKYLNAKTGTSVGAEENYQKTEDTLRKAGVDIKSLGRRGSDRWKKQVGQWFEIMHALQEEFPNEYYLASSLEDSIWASSEGDERHTAGVSGDFIRGTIQRAMKKKTMGEMIEYAKRELRERRNLRSIEMFGGLDNLEKQRKLRDSAIPFKVQNNPNSFIKQSPTSAERDVWKMLDEDFENNPFR